MDESFNQDLRCFDTVINETDEKFYDVLTVPLSAPEVVLPPVSEKPTNVPFINVSSSVPILNMSNLSSQELRFFDNPVNSPMFNGYKAEQLYGLSSIPPPATETTIEPSIQEGSTESSSTELSHVYSSISIISMTGTGLNTSKNDLKCNSCGRVFSRFWRRNANFSSC